MEATYVPDCDERGEVRGFYALVLDVTDRNRAQQEARSLLDELAHADRISMMGELATTLAHELNQPMTAIMSNAQAATRFLDGPSPDLDEVREILREIAEEDARAGEVIRRMRTLVKKERASFQPLDLNETVHEVVWLLRSDAVIRKVAIELQLDPDLPAVSGDRIQLQQVVMNLLLNAFDAIGESSTENRTVLVETRHDDEEIQRRGPRLRRRASPPRRWNACSSRSTPPSRTGWAWGCRSADRSSGFMAAASGARTTPARERRSPSRCPSLRCPRWREVNGERVVADRLRGG